MQTPANVYLPRGNGQVPVLSRHGTASPFKHRTPEKACDKTNLTRKPLVYHVNSHIKSKNMTINYSIIVPSIGRLRPVVVT